MQALPPAPPVHPPPSVTRPTPTPAPPPGAGEGNWHPRPYNALAIVSISFAGSAFIGTWCLGGLVAIVTGHIARSQIRRTGESGDSLALAGLILGYIALSSFLLLATLYVLFFVFLFAFAATHSTPLPSPSPRI